MLRTKFLPLKGLMMVSRYQELGVASDYDPRWGLRGDEFLADLRGTRGIKRLREMASNDPIIGAILAAMDLMIRSTPWRFEGGSDEARELVEFSLHNMQDQTFEEFISDVLSFLPFGFSVFEIVARPPRASALPSDSMARERGWVTLKKLAPRAQWTVDRFDTNDNGDLLGVWQLSAQKSAYIPYGKMLHFRTTSRQADPAGVSVLRSAYSSWYYANRIKEIEAIAIERELNGIPLVRVPSEYLAPDANAAQRAFVDQIKTIARDVKRNEQGFIILPSDLYQNDDGKYTTTRMVEFELIASDGKRDIDTNMVIQRYQQDMARSALADFVLLGSNDRGSFALSKSKADLFLKALEGYLDSISAVLNRRLVPKLLEWNGIPESDAPKITHGRIAPIDLTELGTFTQKLALAGIDLSADLPTVNFLRGAAGLPPAESLPEPPTDETPDTPPTQAESTPPA